MPAQWFVLAMTVPGHGRCREQTYGSEQRELPLSSLPRLLTGGCLTEAWQRGRALLWLHVGLHTSTGLPGCLPHQLAAQRWLLLLAGGVVVKGLVVARSDWSDS